MNATHDFDESLPPQQVGVDTLAGSLGAWGGAPEPVGACGEGVVEDLLAAGLDGPGGAVVDGGGGVQADSGMAVLRGLSETLRRKLSRMSI